LPGLAAGAGAGVAVAAAAAAGCGVAVAAGAAAGFGFGVAVGVAADPNGSEYWLSPAPPPPWASALDGSASVTANTASPCRRRMSSRV
jgi:hypothetical protein